MVSAGWKEDDVVGARLPRGQMSDDHAALRLVHVCCHF